MAEMTEQSALLDSLTEKQREVLSLVSEGLTSKEIARKLGVSESAVNQRIEGIRQRLGGLPRSQIGRLYRRLTTVTLTVPSSNSLTGKPLQLLADPGEEQHDDAGGAEFDLPDPGSMSAFGSRPSAPLSFMASLDAPYRRLLVVVAAALGLAVLMLVLVATAHALDHLSAR